MTTIIVCLGIIVGIVLYMIFNTCRGGSRASRMEEYEELLRQMEEASKPRIMGEM